MLFLAPQGFYHVKFSSVCCHYMVLCWCQAGVGFFKPCALYHGIHKWLPLCSQTISFSIQGLVSTGHIYIYLYVLLEQQLLLHKTLASWPKLLSLQFLKYSGTFQRFQDCAIFSVGIMAQSKLDNYEECPILQIWTIFAFFLGFPVGKIKANMYTLKLNTECIF